VGTDTTSWQFAVRTPEQRDRASGMPQSVAGSGHGQQNFRSLLQAAGMTPITDEALAEESAFGISGRGLPLIELRDANAEGTRYCVATTVDYRGRLAHRTPLKIMGWKPATSVTISMLPNAGIIIVDHGFAVGDQALGDLPADAAAPFDGPQPVRVLAARSQHGFVTVAVSGEPAPADSLFPVVDDLDRRGTLVRVHTDDDLGHPMFPSSSRQVVSEEGTATSSWAYPS
jgi:hypothetical protein